MDRAALYIRVSTEEQAMHGYSLDAQREALTKYAKEHDLFIVDYYQDEGKSARKPYKTRPECMRMIRDVEQGKIDVILFIKLDRWFRNVGEYYKVQEILERHHVSWRAILEDYETVTSSGQLKVNIMLSVAQNEADRTSERIKFVFESKIARGEAVTGRVPPGFRIENKHLVHDPEKAEIVRDLFRRYDETSSKHGTIMYAYEKYGIMIDRHYFFNMLHNTLYKGEFRGIAGYCEPIIEPEVFDRVNARRTIRANRTGRVYIFSGLAVCAECGYRMAARHSYNNTGQQYIYYRCNRYSNYKACIHDKMKNEKDIEAWLLENVEDEISKYLADCQLKAVRKAKPPIDRAGIKRKLAKLKDLYINDMIDIEAYKADYEKYTAQLAALQEPAEPKADTKALENFLRSGFKAGYDSMSSEERQQLWRGVIKKILIDAQGCITISFT